ncbi:MAG TPA: SDR family oxidoreductase [Solirubrobacterales bacterium]|nr:SDR family oxidoreductase [Solirubrobacterales bacterium]
MTDEQAAGTTPRTHEGRAAVVTGAARGIGQALCRGLAENGADVIGVDLEDLRETGAAVEKAGARWIAAQVDVTDAHAMAELATEVEDQLGGTHILINNAAIDDPISWDELDLDHWRRVLAVDLEAPFLTCKAFVPQMRAAGWGRIVNIASGSVLRAMPRFVAYRAAKMGLIGFTRALASEVGPDGITVNVASPGITVTKMALGSLDPEVVETESSRRAIPRIGEPDDMVGTVLFLTAEASAFVTGQTLLPNGGAAFV